MTHVKGSALLSTVRFIQERFGPEGLRAVLADLEPDDRAAVEGGLLASSWYPFSLMLRLMQAAGRFDAGRTLHLYRQMGRASADYSLTTIYRIFFKIGSPQFTLARAARVFGNYYDTGRMEAIVNDKGHAVVELTGFADPAPEFCERLWGWMERTITLIAGMELAKASHVRCVHRGDPTCQFEGFWDQ
jgi:hypothetical protein